MEPYYSDALVTIYHGDCRSILPGLEREHYAILTDPPYAVRRAAESICVECGNDVATVGWSTCSECMFAGVPVAEFEMLGHLSRGLDQAITHSRGYADHEPEAFAELLAGFATAALEVALEGSPMVAFGGARTYHQLATALELAGWRIHDMVIWAHDPGMPKARTCLAPAHDPAVLATHGTPDLDFRTADTWPRNVVESDRNREAISHLTPKPISLMRTLVQMFPAPVILDPFMGSGSTLRAAKDLCRQAIGIEVDEASCEVAARRLGQEVLDFDGVC